MNFSNQLTVKRIAFFKTAIVYIVSFHTIFYIRNPK